MKNPNTVSLVQVHGKNHTIMFYIHMLWQGKNENLLFLFEASYGFFLFLMSLHYAIHAHLVLNI